MHAHAHKHGSLLREGMEPPLPVPDSEDPTDLSPQDGFLVAGNRFRELVDAVNNAQSTDRRLSTDRMTLEKDKVEVSAQISENPDDENSVLKGRLSEIEKDLRSNAEAAQANLAAERVARDEAAVLRQKFVTPSAKRVAVPPPSALPSDPDANARHLLQMAGITKLSPKCERSKELAKRTTDDTWIQLMLLGCSQRAKEFINQQGWDDCEGIVEAATTRRLPHREEACHIFAKACPGAEMGTKHFSSLVLVYKLACLKHYGEASPPEPAEVGPPQQLSPTGNIPSLAILNRDAALVARGDADEVEEQLSMDPDHKNILWVKAIYEDQRLKSLRALAGIVKDYHLPSKRLWGRFEKMKRDIGYFEVIEWGKMESKARGKLFLKKQREGLQHNANGG